VKNYPGVLRSDEFKLVQHVFREIVKEPWFSRDIARQQQFGAFVIRAYQSGTTDTGKLYDLCARTAQDRFSDTTH
jgi:hypothetical protein